MASIYNLVSLWRKRIFGQLSLVLISLTATIPASASSGWYLLVPQRTEYKEQSPFLQGYRILSQRPLSEWVQQGAYESATECEVMRDTFRSMEDNMYQKSAHRYIEDVGAKKDPIVLQFQRSIVELHNANVAAYLASRCIQSNDPRLKQ